jgi:hypothetical protein
VLFKRYVSTLFRVNFPALTIVNRRNRPFTEQPKLLITGAAMRQKPRELNFCR